MLKTFHQIKFKIYKQYYPPTFAPDPSYLFIIVIKRSKPAQIQVKGIQYCVFIQLHLFLLIYYITSTEIVDDKIYHSGIKIRESKTYFITIMLHDIPYYTSLFS